MPMTPSPVLPGSARSRPSGPLRSAVVALTAVVVAVGVVAAVHPTGLSSSLAAQLPRTSRTDRLADSQGNAWQSAQGFMTVSQGANALNTLAQQSLSWTDNPKAPELDGRWFAVDYFPLDQDGAVHTDNYLVDDHRLTLQAVEGPSIWVTYLPGLPVLDADRLPAGNSHWSGTVTASSDGEHTSTFDATADIRVAADPSRPGCVDSTAQISYDDGSDSTSTTTWCSGDDAGWAGTDQGASSLHRESPSKDSAPAAELDQPTAQPEHTTGHAKQATKYRFVSNGTYLLPWVSVHHSTMAGSTVVTARSTGELSAWRPYSHGLADHANRELLWRAWPGGVVTALSSIGSVTIAASSSDTVTAYGSDGGQLWQTATDEVVTSITRSGTSVVVVVDAAGRVRGLDARTGAERWSRGFGDRVTVAAQNGSVAVQTADELTVLDAGSGRPRWSRGNASTQPVITGDVVASEQVGGTLVARSLQDGEPVWTRATDPLAVISGSADQLLVRGAASVYSLAADGSVRWRADRTNRLATAGRWTALSYPDRIELWDQRGRVRSWPLRHGFGQAGSMLITDAGVMAWGQQTPEGYQDWEYR